MNFGFVGYKMVKAVMKAGCRRKKSLINWEQIGSIIFNLLYSLYAEFPYSNNNLSPSLYNVTIPVINRVLYCGMIVFSAWIEGPSKKVFQFRGILLYLNNLTKDCVLCILYRYYITSIKLINKIDFNRDCLQIYVTNVKYELCISSSKL